MRIAEDKIGHFIGGLAIVGLFNPFGWAEALAAVVLIGIGKEVVWDKWLGRGTPEVADALATILGGALLLGWQQLAPGVIGALTAILPTPATWLTLRPTIDLPLVLAIALGTLQALDALLTLKALQLGGREVNPILARLFDLIGPVPTLLAVKGGVVVWIWLNLAAMPVSWLTALCAFYVAVCWHNIQQLRR